MNILTFISVIVVINIVMVGITDMTDWPSQMKRIVTYILTRGKIATDDYESHLIECSLCQVFHLSNIWLIVYLIMGGTFTPWIIALPILSALSTTITKSLLFLMMDICNALIKLIYKIINHTK